MGWINKEIGNSFYHYYISESNDKLSDNSASRKRNLLYLHGFGATAEISLNYVKALESKYNLIIPEFPGHGYLRDKYSDECINVDQVTEYLKPLLIELGLQLNFFLLGRSVGGVIGLMLLKNEWFKPLKTVIVQSPVSGYKQGITFVLKGCLKIVPMIKPVFLVRVFKTFSKFSSIFGFKINTDEVNQLEVLNLHLIRGIVESILRFSVLPTKNVLYIFGGKDLYLTGLNSKVAEKTGSFKFDLNVKHFGNLNSVSINNAIMDFLG